MIRVFVADDHEIVCVGLRRWCATIPTLEWAGSTGDWRVLMEGVVDDLWDVVVLDLSLPGRSGTELLREILAGRPGIRVVVYSMYPAEDYAAWAMASGASAYVSKSQPLSVLRDALLDISPVGASQKPIPLPHERLSAREKEVFLAVARGRTPSEISWELEMAPSTVSTHLKSIRFKLGVRSALEIGQYAVRNGITGMP
jgi:two-component system, NarL family, invasion response regulator UvrY